jgi:hypothetical protein
MRPSYQPPFLRTRSVQDLAAGEIGKNNGEFKCKVCDAGAGRPQSTGLARKSPVARKARGFSRFRWSGTYDGGLDRCLLEDEPGVLNLGQAEARQGGCRASLSAGAALGSGGALSGECAACLLPFNNIQESKFPNKGPFLGATGRVPLWKPSRAGAVEVNPLVTAMLHRFDWPFLALLLLLIVLLIALMQGPRLGLSVLIKLLTQRAPTAAGAHAQR